MSTLTQPQYDVHLNNVRTFNILLVAITKNAISDLVLLEKNNRQQPPLS